MAAGWNPRERKFAMETLLKLALMVVGTVSAAQPGLAQTPKVGTFDRASIVVAFYGSPLWAAELKAKQAEMQQARQANDQKKIDELQRWGRDGQELAHKQLAGEAGIDNILEMMKPMLAAVAAQAHVVSIAPEVPGADKTAATVDVTGLLLDRLQASAKTRQIIEELRKSQKEGSPR